MALAAAPGCTASRARIEDPALAQRRQTLITDQDQLLDGVIGRLVARLEDRGGASAGTHAAPDPVLDVLVISGGGPSGAFGAGFLSGWGLVADPDFKRPDFDLVWGVSTGAIIAPFAFAGTDASYERIEWFYRHPSSDWVTRRDWFSWLPFRTSMMDTDGLRDALRAAVSDEIIAKAAARSRAGASLLVGTTDLDQGSLILWDMGAEFERAADGGTAGRALSILSASTAIPVLFPAEPIDQGVYADGGITSILLGRDDYNGPGALIDRWRRAHPSGKPPVIRCWVIMNIRVQTPPEFVDVQWSSVLPAALGATIRSATWLQARLLASQLDYINARGWARCELRTAAIPDTWRPPVEDEFDPKTMNNLADIGHAMGADPTSWRLLTLPLPPN